jgi:hypothetical protein
MQGCLTVTLKTGHADPPFSAFDPYPESIIGKFSVDNIDPAPIHVKSDQPGIRNLWSYQFDA